MRAFLQPLTLFVLLMNGDKAFGGEFYRCRAPGLPPQFSQFPCTSPQQSDASATAPAASSKMSPEVSAIVVQDRVTVGDVQSLAIPALSSHERRRLEQAEQRAVSRQRSVQKSRARNAVALRRLRTLRAERCQAARRGLRELAARKRKGYPLRDARRLAERERVLEREADDSC